jgi:hypothetical protein
VHQVSLCSLSSVTWLRSAFFFFFFFITLFFSRWCLWFFLSWQAVHLYWIATSMLQVGQFFFFRIPFMRRTFNLPANVGSVTHHTPPPPVVEVAKVVSRPVRK